MNGDILDNGSGVSGNDAFYPLSVKSSEEYSEDSGQSVLSDFGSGGDLSSSNGMIYDEELGGYPVVIVSDVSSEEVALLSLPSGSRGYQLSDYWKDYFRGVLQKHWDSDYLAFATRENGTNNYNSVTHYWLYIGDIENGGKMTVYDCYTENSIYYVDVSTETMGGIDIDSYSTLAYSNLGHMSDLREGGGYIGDMALLFFLAFFAVYVVCRTFFDCVGRKLYRK